VVRDVHGIWPVLRVMTYNIRHGRGVDGRVDLGRTAAAIAEYEPDVVALQEVDAGRLRSGHADQAEELAQRLGMEMRFETCIASGDERYGIATLARVPMVSTHRVCLPHSEGLRLSEPRCALVSRVAWDGGEIDIVNTHLSLRPDERGKQATALVAELSHGDDAIVLGDLNCTPWGAGYRRLAARLRDVGSRAASWPAWYPILRLDHVLYQGDLEVGHASVLRRGAARRASDHLPVVAMLRPSQREGP
jgi:endonuclease/exonuclease/phosphatase family metal-dependent hydrolase